MNILCPSIVSLYMSIYSLNKQAADQRQKRARLNPCPLQDRNLGHINQDHQGPRSSLMLWSDPSSHPKGASRVIQKHSVCWEQGVLGCSGRLAPLQICGNVSLDTVMGFLSPLQYVCGATTGECAQQGLFTLFPDLPCQPPRPSCMPQPSFKGKES